jgi:hypothetical protein
MPAHVIKSIAVSLDFNCFAPLILLDLAQLVILGLVSVSMHTSAALWSPW